jgi:hypothetical protein
MVRTVRVLAAAMVNPLHGSVWSYQDLPVMILKLVYVLMSQVIVTKMSSSKY